jgi:hypothetical protein
MNESAYLNELFASKELGILLRAKREDLLQFLRSRFSKQVSPAVTKLIQEVETPEVLDFWIRQAGCVDSFAEFESIVRQ